MHLFFNNDIDYKQQNKITQHFKLWLFKMALKTQTVRTYGLYP